MLRSLLIARGHRVRHCLRWGATTPFLCGRSPLMLVHRNYHHSAEPLALHSISQLLGGVRKKGAPEGTVTVQGWVQSVRLQKKMAFLTVSDGSSAEGLEVVVDLNAIELSTVKELGMGASIKLVGDLVPHLRKQDAFELQISSNTGHGIQLVGACDTKEYPLQKKFQTTEFLRSDKALHLRLRTRRMAAVARVRSRASFAIHEFFVRRDFAYVHTPIITPSDCEGGGELFRVEQAREEEELFFGSTAHLAVSGQLYGEMCASSLRKVYTFGPTFRAENSHTSRHLAEFWMVEPELAFCDLPLLMSTAQSFVQHVIKVVLDECSADLQLLQQHTDSGDKVEGTLVETLHSYSEGEFAVLRYADAVALVNEEPSVPSVDVANGESMGSVHEQWLASRSGGPVFVTHFPEQGKPFYMRRAEGGSVVNCMDLYVPGIGELIGGSEREADYHALVASLQAQGIPLEEYRWYTDLRRFGTTPHAGFGLGFDRLVQLLVGAGNIRDVVTVPRGAQLMPF